mgnify:CR=1 FL=1
MKMIKPVVLGIVVALAINATAQNQNKEKTPTEKAERVSAKLTEAYDLDEKQAATVKAAHLNFSATIGKIKQDESITGEVKKAQITAAKAEMDAAVKTVLTDEQFVMYHEASEKRVTARKDRMKENRTPEAMAKHKAEKLAARLSDVTDEQQSQMEVLFLKVAQKIEAVKTNESLTEDQKVAFVKGNKTDGQNALTTILTEDQLLELDKLKSIRKAAHSDAKDIDIK